VWIKDDAAESKEVSEMRVSGAPPVGETCNRRDVLVAAPLLCLSAASVADAAQRHDSVRAELPALVHHVFFWLKNPQSKADLERLLQGLRNLRQIEVVKAIHIGVPANTEQRSVVDASYQVSELLMFADLAAQKKYQDHPVHQQFVADCAHLWERVVVYDTVEVG
jgi:hypothetical protein